MTLQDLKNRDESERNSTPIPTRWNKDEIEELNELMTLLGEEKTSTAIKRGVIIANHVLHMMFGKQFTIQLSRRKQKEYKRVYT
jgi:hypothetical protein